MQKHVLAFAAALGVLIIAVSAWVVFERQAEPPAAEVAELQPELLAQKGVNTKKIERKRGFAEHLAAGEIALTAEKYAEAAAEFAAAAKLEPGEIEPLLLLAETQIRQQEFEKARGNLAAAEQLDAVHPDIFILRGIISLREKNFPVAEEFFAKAAENAKFWRGLLAAFYDRKEEAQKLLAESGDARASGILAAFAEYAGFPDSPKTHLDVLLARAFSEIGEQELAIAKIKPVLADDPDYRDAWLLLGYAQFARENYELAQQAWQTAYSLDPAKPETQYFLGLVNLANENFAEAEHFLLLAQENRFGSSELAGKLAEAYLAQGKYRAAADLLAQRLAENPAAALEDFTQPIYLYLENLRDGQAAWELAKTALARQPQTALAENLAGWVSLENGYLKEAQGHLQKAIALDGELPWPYYNLGRYFEKTGHPASALAAYRQTIELDPDGPVGALAAENYNRLLKAN